MGVSLVAVSTQGWMRARLNMSTGNSFFVVYRSAQAFSSAQELQERNEAQAVLPAFSGLQDLLKPRLQGSTTVSDSQG